MLINPGEKLHLITRRSFEGDSRRHFAGEVIDATETAVLASGYVFVFNARTNQYTRRPELRSRVISLVDGRNTINMLPKDAKIDNVTYKLSTDRQLVVTDEETFTLNVDEFSKIF